MQILLSDDLTEAKWKNGGGITRNIAVGMLGDISAWRISRADVATEGPFSNFAGLTRILTVVSSNSMELVHEDGTLQARPWEPVLFDGGMPVVSRLPDGPLTDLNLMFDPTLCSGSAQVQRGPLDLAPPPEGYLCVLHVLAGNPSCGAETFGTADTLFLEPNCGADVQLKQGDAVLMLLIAPLDQSADMRLCIADR
ncbi:MAG: HutD family protein [Sulfitobacter sp.]